MTYTCSHAARCWGSPILLNQSNSLFSGLFDMRNVADHSWVTKNINKMLCWLKSRVWDRVRICIWIWPGLNTWNWKWTLIRNWILSSTPHLDSNFDLNLDPVTDFLSRQNLMFSVNALCESYGNSSIHVRNNASPKTSPCWMTYR